MQKTLNATPMSKSDAETKTGEQFSGNDSDETGYLFYDEETSKYDWLPKKMFHAVPCDTVDENTSIFMKGISKWILFFQLYTKHKRGITRYESMQVYIINKHLKSIESAVQKILNINIKNETL